MFAALQAVGTNAAQLHNFEHCGSAATSQWSEFLQRRRLRAYYCRCRHCEPCARAKANKIAANLRAKIGNAPHGTHRLFTFTLKHNAAPLAEQIRRLFAAFKKIRSAGFWKKTQRGGAMLLEVKWTGTEWHPHLHCVGEGRYIDRRALSDAWLKATGDSFIVDVRILSRGQDAVAYVTKYVTKSTSDSVWSNPDAAQEWILASKGVRTANTYGSWRKFPLLAKSEDATDWVREDSLTGLLTRAMQGDRIAIDILRTLRPDAQPEESHDFRTDVLQQDRPEDTWGNDPPI